MTLPTVLSMKSLMTPGARQFLLFVVLLFALLGAEARDVSRTMGISQRVFDKIQVVQELIEAGNFDQAGAKLQDLQGEKLSDYERAQTWFLTGYVEYEKEDYPAAIAAYQRVADTKGLPLGMQQSVIKTLSQLSLMTEDYVTALRYIEMLLVISEEPQPDHHALKAQVHYRLEQMDAAEIALDEAIRLQAQRGDAPLENWLLLKNAVLFHRNDYQGMLLVVQQLVDLYPRDRYLLNLAAIYGELENSEKQLALMEPLYERGGLHTSSQMLNLASLYMLHDIPFKAATLLDKEIKSLNIAANEQNLRMLGQAWVMAANVEQAIEPLGKAAAQSDDGDLYVNLARTYTSLFRWKEAEASLNKAFSKGKLKDPGGALLLRGMARFNQKEFHGARRDFADAGKDPKVETLASQWLQYLEREEEKARLAEQAAKPLPAIDETL